MFASVSAFPSDAAVADLFLIADAVEVVVAIKTLTVVQKQSLNGEILSEWLKLENSLSLDFRKWKSTILAHLKALCDAVLFKDLSLN